MNTTTLRFGTRSFVIFSLLALPAGSIACGAAPGTDDEGVDPSASATAPTEKTTPATTDTDAAAPDDEPTGVLPDPTSGGPGHSGPYRGGPRQK
jgi:hypothetical protein